MATHGDRLRALLSNATDLDSLLVHTDPVDGQLIATTQLVPYLGPDNELIMLPKGPRTHHAFVAPSPRPAWMVDAVTQVPSPAPSIGPTDTTTAPPPRSIGMSHSEARAMARALLLPGGHSTAIWVNPDAMRRGASAPRYRACAAAGTIGEYMALHQAYAPGADAKPSASADLIWSLRRGDITVLPDPDPAVLTGIARRARATFADDPATAMLAERLDHVYAAQRGLDDLGDLELHPAIPSDFPSEVGPWPGTDPRLHTNAYESGLRVLRASMADDTADLGQDHADDPPIDTNYTEWPLDTTTVMFAAPTAPDLAAPASMRAAMRDPDWGVPHGWKAASNKEIVRVEGFNGWVPITGRERRRLQRAHPQQVTNGHIVVVLTVKRGSIGQPPCTGHRAQNASRNFRPPS